MKILVTGNEGYVGSVLVEELMREDNYVIGYDTGYYDGFLYPNTKSHIQIRKDIRDVSGEDLKDVEAIIHLAALSNDPLGELDGNLTHEINFLGTIRLAQYAKEAGVKRFIYASSQSMYGISDSDDELDEDASKSPLTMYAKTKWDAECALKDLSSDDFIVTCFRPSTVFGVSPNLRCDIVFNNLVACAFTTGSIEIKSDGTPWRPVVHIRDVAAAFMAGIKAPAHLISGESFNVGIENGNYTVRDLAEAAQKAVPGSTLIFTGEHGSDSRTYKISFQKILQKLSDYYKPQWNLESGGAQLVDMFKRVNFTQERFRGKEC
ncbi:MAG: SDR family oxidoreductase, partial [Nanoarchaeota archaeon]|nr:SDR family oxidoreductase [Nanoarchaeota archaeon]